jgi:2-keto-4-pentenoate hydratase
LSAVRADPRIARGLEAQLRVRRERLAAGEEAVGWKVALNAPPVQQRLGISEPVIGFLSSGSRIEPGSEQSLAGTTALGVEAEIALHVSRDVPPDADTETCASAIGAIAPALELVDVDLPFDDLELILARNVFHHAFALGADDPGRAGGKLDGLSVVLARNGEVEQSVEAVAALPDPAGVVGLVANVLALGGELLCAGDVIISGALTPNVWPEKGDRVDVDFGPLGVLALSFGSA